MLPSRLHGAHSTAPIPTFAVAVIELPRRDFASDSGCGAPQPNKIDVTLRVTTRPLFCEAVGKVPNIHSQSFVTVQRVQHAYTHFQRISSISRGTQGRAVPEHAVQLKLSG